MTIIELVVVVILIALLATIGFVQYNKMVEKGRTAEAKAVLGLIRSAQHGYKQQYGAYTSVLDRLGIESLVTSCTSTHYYSYGLDNVLATATRCTASGKTPDAPVYSITLDYDTGVISGDATYY
ncbi:MAG: prepilin-type N-terminal cleavage/methylation domain-containing protein [Candidatus Omnitrophica bacterium]|nr:prepilin-type N-terminal cleavage/methylation domain-containing protein [Candidatus Omnitrophota bacterium]